MNDWDLEMQMINEFGNDNGTLCHWRSISKMKKRLPLQLNLERNDNFFYPVLFVVQNELNSVLQITGPCTLESFFAEVESKFGQPLSAIQNSIHFEPRTRPWKRIQLQRQSFLHL